ncbi:MAG: hypothetical protein U0X76_02145 [Bacteroidia bacterium]
MAVSVLPTYKKNKFNPAYNALGASGAVAAIVFSFILFEPLQKIYLFAMIPDPTSPFWSTLCGLLSVYGPKGGMQHHYGALMRLVLVLFYGITRSAGSLQVLQKLIYFRNGL